MKKTRAKAAKKKAPPRKTVKAAKTKGTARKKAGPARTTGTARTGPVVTSTDSLENQSPAEVARAGLQGFDAGDLRQARRSLQRLVELLAKKKK